MYACFCEVDRDCAPVSQWCEPCRQRQRLYVTLVTVFGPLDERDHVMRRTFTYGTDEPHTAADAEAAALDHYMSAWAATADCREGVIA